MDLLCINPADISACYWGIALICAGAFVKVLWHGRFAIALAMSLGVAGVLIVSESKAEALPVFTCEELNQMEWPCWLIWLHGCWCTWDDAHINLPQGFGLNTDEELGI